MRENNYGNMEYKVSMCFMKENNKDKETHKCMFKIEKESIDESFLDIKDFLTELMKYTNEIDEEKE